MRSGAVNRSQCFRRPKLGSHQLNVCSTRCGEHLGSLEVKLKRFTQAPKSESSNQFQPFLSIYPTRTLHGERIVTNNYVLWKAKRLINETKEPKSPPVLEGGHVPGLGVYASYARVEFLGRPSENLGQGSGSRLPCPGFGRGMGTRVEAGGPGR